MNKQNKYLKTLVMMMQHEPLTEIIPYRRTVWITNFAKTVTTTTLVSSGIGLIITGLTTRMQNQGYSNAELILGAIAIALAIIIVTFIDRWAEQKEKEKLETIDKVIDERAEQIAEELVLKHLEEIEENNI